MKVKKRTVMKMPGFTAEASLHKKGESYRILEAAIHHGGAVQPVFGYPCLPPCRYEYLWQYQTWICVCPHPM